MSKEYSTLNDGCEGDSEGLAMALGDAFELIREYCDDEGWGHHTYDAIFRATDGRYIHAECGGCSCGGSGSWSYAESVQDAERLIPEWRREQIAKWGEP